MRLLMRWLSSLIVTATLAVTAADQTISITDYTGRGFAPDLVQYDLPKAVDSKSISLTDSAGQAVPFQISTSKDKAVLSFIAQVPHDETATWKLSAGNSAGVKGSVKAEQTATSLVLKNDRFSVTLPAIQDKTFAPPVPVRTLPAPLQNWTSRGSASMGAASMLSERLVKRLRVYLAEQGDVFTDAVYEIEWNEGGFYRCTIRVMDRVPLAQIIEEYDLGKLDGSDFWEIDLGKGWSPDTVETAQPWGNGTVGYAGSSNPLEWLTRRKPFMQMGCDNGHVGHLGLSIAQQVKDAPDKAPLAGMVLLHKGEWRRSNVLRIYSEKVGDVRVHLPMTARNTSWTRDSASVSSPFSTHSFDPALPPTYARRVWGLMLAPVELPKAQTARFRKEYAMDPYEHFQPFARARSVYGVVGLNRYKDYILDWPDSGLKYPRAFHARKSPEQLRNELAQSTLPDELKQKLSETYVSFATPEKRPDVKARVERQSKDLLISFASYFTNCPTPSNHPCSGAYPAASLLDDLLAQPDVSPELRKELRSRIALLVYLYHEPDVMNYGSGIHPGNPNMDTARFFPGVGYVPLVADHPNYDNWRKRIAEYAEYKLATQMAPGGAYFEFGTYHMHGFRIRHVLSAIAALNLPNADLIFDYFKKDMDYFMNLLTPYDKRYESRLIPGLANSEPNVSPALLEAAGVLAEKDPAFAANLLGAWLENGKRVEDTGNVPLALKPQMPGLKSRYFPGFGVIFRAHQGPDETFFMLRAGSNWSHWYIDPGHFVMGSRGAMLVPFQPYQYYDSPKNDFDLYNTMRFGDAKNNLPMTWPDSNVLDCTLGGDVEYAWSSHGVPDWFINPGISDEFKPPSGSAARPLDPAFQQKEGAMDWDRQVFFLKGSTAQSPNYFVIRDTTRGDGKLATFLNLNLLGQMKDLAINGNHLAANTEFPTKLDVFFPDRSELKVDSAEMNLPFASQIKGALKSSPRWADSKEQHVNLRIAAAPEEGYAWVLWPRDEKESPPKVTQPAPNVVKIEHREGIDYVFASAVPFKFEGDGVSFEGRAGTVRVKEDHALLGVLTGYGRVAYKKQLLSGFGPFEQKVPLKGEKSETIAASKPSIVRPANVLEGWTQHLHERDQAPLSANNVYIEGGAASVLIKGDMIRVIAPEADYVKAAVGNVGVRGLGPFDLTLTPTGITGTADGACRTIVTTIPEKVTRPMFQLDGRRWYAGWADDPSISKGTKSPQFALAFAVTGGPQKVEISEWKFPNQPPPVPRRVAPLP